MGAVYQARPKEDEGEVEVEVLGGKIIYVAKCNKFIGDLELIMYWATFFVVLYSTTFLASQSHPILALDQQR